MIFKRLGRLGNDFLPAKSFINTHAALITNNVGTHNSKNLVSCWNRLWD